MRTCRFSYEINAFSYKKTQFGAFLFAATFWITFFAAQTFSNKLWDSLLPPFWRDWEFLGRLLGSLGCSWAPLGPLEGTS